MAHLKLVLCLLFGLSAVLATPLDDYVNLPDPTLLIQLASYKYEVKNVLKAEAITIYIVNMTCSFSDLVDPQRLQPLSLVALHGHLRSRWSEIRYWFLVHRRQRQHGFDAHRHRPSHGARLPRYQGRHWYHHHHAIMPPSVAHHHRVHLFHHHPHHRWHHHSIQSDYHHTFRSDEKCTAHLYQVPNQPIYFADGKKRSEDALIAYTWSHFINNTNEPYWLARMPMTKAAVRALDTMADVVAKYTPSAPAITQFVVAGASKRGWTTWTTAAVDKRVVAIAPMVIPVLDIVPNIGRQWQAYGGWSFALDDYLSMHLMSYLNQPVFQQMADIIDPYAYIDRLTMPKYIICSTGDEFFLPDSPSFFYNKLKGEKHLYMVPNAEHSLTGHQAAVGIAIASFSDMFLKGTPRPNVNWTIEYTQDGGKITVYSDTKPQAITMTLSYTKRDFRLVTCWDIENCFQPVFWFESTPQNPSPGVYVAELQNPPNGWAGFYVELDFYPDNSNPIADSLRITTEIAIVPNTLPYPPCGNHCQ